MRDKKGEWYYNADCKRCNDFLKNYGINSVEYDWMHFLNGRVCDWPGCTQNSTCFDHDHENGQHRGFLCPGHNTGLGKLGDNLAGLMAGIQYLTRNDETTN